MQRAKMRAVTPETEKAKQTQRSYPLINETVKSTVGHTVKYNIRV